MRDIIRASSCTDAWLQGANHLRKQREWRDYNLVLEISQPMSLSSTEKQIAGEVDKLLRHHDKHSLSTVINTIFPASLYAKHGGNGLFARYNEVREELRTHPETKWGTYFMRMTGVTKHKGKRMNLLEHLIHKLRREVKNRGSKRAIYELNLLDPAMDIPIYDSYNDKNYTMGGPCLSHLSFKLKQDHSLLLTAVYRSHYYIQRALGNFYGLAMLQNFVATEAGIKANALICHSTMAILDHDKINQPTITKMLDMCSSIQKQTECSVASS